MGAVNKKHSRKLRRRCPVCGSRVMMAKGRSSWWVYCPEDTRHIPQSLFYSVYEAIGDWNSRTDDSTQ